MQKQKEWNIKIISISRLYVKIALYVCVSVLKITHLLENNNFQLHGRKLINISFNFLFKTLKEEHISELIIL